MTTIEKLTLLRQLLTEYAHLVKIYVDEVPGFKHIGYPKKCHAQPVEHAKSGKIDAALAAIKEAKRKLPGGVIGFLKSELSRLERMLDHLEAVGNPDDLIKTGDRLLAKLQDQLKPSWVDVPRAIKAHKNSLDLIPRDRPHRFTTCREGGSKRARKAARTKRCRTRRKATGSS